MHLHEFFASEYSELTPEFLVEAPGRVNLIGEHTDYNGLPVMPLALTRAVRVLLRRRDDNTVNITSAFGARSFQLEETIAPSPMGDWVNYVKAAHQGLIGYIEGRTWTGFDGVLLGDVPPGGGLSSSSALVVASAYALLAANGVDIPRPELAELMAVSERYVGTAGGGMDQAACIQAEAGCALKIDFFPLRTRAVSIPDNVSVVVANSLVTAEKTGTARLKYNRRPMECRLATRVVAKALAEKTGRDFSSVARLGDLTEELTGMDAVTLQNVVLGEIIHTEPYSETEIADFVGMDVATLRETVLTMPDGTVFPEPEDGFLLYERVRHVLTEGARVNAAADALERGDLDEVGTLMKASHASCRDDYGISTAELDTLVNIMLDAGAYGARLTGAGFGGCAVALIPAEKEAAFIETVRSRYYGDYLRKTAPPEGLEWNEVIFATKAGPGARVMDA